MSDQPDLVRQILSGRNRELRLLAAQGLVPLTPGELLPLQVKLAGDEDAQIAQAASRALGAVEPRLLVDFIEDGAPLEVLIHFSRHHRHAPVLEAILRRRDVPPEVLIELARTLPQDQQEILLLRQDLIIASPAILDALGENPQLSNYSRRRIDEYREHLLPREAPVKTPDELEREADALSEAELELAIEAARLEDAGKGEIDESTGLSDSQVRSLPVPVRLKLTRGAPPSLRNLLVRDPNPLVATSVLRSNPLQDSEVERIASSRSVVPEVLEAISRDRHWTRRYTVILSLVRNPRTPAGIAMRFLSRVSVRDLNLLKRDRNVSHTVREGAKRLSKIKRS